MTTEREYQEWHRKTRKNTPQKKYAQKKPNLSLIWVFALFVISALLAAKNNLKIPKFTLYLTNPLPALKQTLQVQPTAVKPGFSETIRNFNYEPIDNVAQSIQYQGTSVSELASILSPYAKTEAEKARIIYSWIAHNIPYDVPGFLSGNYSGNYAQISPENVLRQRTTICSGYANLYQALAKAMGLDAVVINGSAKGADYIIGNDSEINHAWNGVKINNQWYLVDQTWGAGSVNGSTFKKKFNPHYFATPPEQFIYDHFPVETTWQLLTQPYTKAQFEQLPEVSAQFFKDEINFASHYTNKIEANGLVKIALAAPENVIFTARITQNKTPLEGANKYTFVQRQGERVIISASFPSPGNYELEIFSKRKNDLEIAPNMYPHSLTYKIVSQSSGEQFPLNYSTFSEKGAYLYTPLNKYLDTNQPVNFKLNVPNAVEVVVIDTVTNNWTKLTQFGSLFEGNVAVNSGKVKVLAKFPYDNRYWGLVEYN
jgi:transglutaminase/protease-like cytokinesis protein 3